MGETMNRRQLTQREAAVALRVARGATNRQIAQELGISLATVKRHLNNTTIKWNCANRTQIAVQLVTRQFVAAAHPPPQGGDGEVAMP